MKNKLIKLFNRIMDLSIEDARKADLMEMILSHKRKHVYGNISDGVTLVTPVPLSDYIEVGGLKWALQNAGTDAENPNGKLYTWDEAMKLEDETWRLPTDEELEEFHKRTFFGFDEDRSVGIFVDRETNARLELPAVGYRLTDSSGTLYGAGTWGEYWSSVAYDSNYAYYLYFGSGSNLGVGNTNKRYGFSVRCVRR